MGNEEEPHVQGAINFLRTLDIWKHFNDFENTLSDLDGELNSYIERLSIKNDRFNQLPDLNLDNTPKVPSECCKEDENRVYEPQTKSAASIKTPKNRSESLELLQTKFHTNEEVFAMCKKGMPWIKCSIISVYRRPNSVDRSEPVTRFRLRIKTETGVSKVHDANKYGVARIQNHGHQLKPCKRVIAGRSVTNMLPGIIAYEPGQFNYFRYLVILDNGSANYFKSHHIYPIVGQSPIPWIDSRFVWPENSLNERYLAHYMKMYPRRDILQTSEGATIELLRNGLVVPGTVKEIDCDVLHIKYRDGVVETIYRGSPRVNRKHFEDDLPAKVDLKFLHDHIHLDRKIYYEAGRKAILEDVYEIGEDLGRITVSKGEPKARKSTTVTISPPRFRARFDDPDKLTVLDVEERQTRPDHKCSPKCLEVVGLRTETDVEDIQDEFRDVSDLRVPLLLGWKRELIQSRNSSRSSVYYEAPCGKRMGIIKSIAQYLRTTKSIMDIDYFTFDRDVDLEHMNEDLIAYVHKTNIAVDGQSGEPLENKNIYLINQFDHEELPFDFEYRNQPFPHPVLVEKKFTFNFDFKSSCDCDDDCFSNPDCPCHKLNEESANDPKCQYKFKRLHVQALTGIFECNSWCKCSSRCLNRVVQNGVRFRLQVKKTLKKGWGVTTLDYIPKGAFICTYAAELLDDADQYGDSDMYFADLDYISVNQDRKEEQFLEEDEGIVDEDEDTSWLDNPKRKLDRHIEESDTDESSGQTGSSSSSTTDQAANRYPKRNSVRPTYAESKKARQEPRKVKNRVKFRDLHDVLGSIDYTLDARMQGNVGRFFNHSCDPNASVQNVFIETHDLRFPVVAFFSLRTIKAGEEITWNYNYKMGSIPNRVMMCYCGASNCKGRIL